MKKLLLIPAAMRASATCLGVAVLALSTEPLRAADPQPAAIGINFQDDWGDGGGATVTADAFGVRATNWVNVPRVRNSELASGLSETLKVYLPEGGTLVVDWSCTSTYSLLGNPDAPASGENKVAYGYLDDTGAGYRVSVSGLRNSVSSYTVSLISSIYPEETFADAQVIRGGVTNLLTYGPALQPIYEGRFATTGPSDALQPAKPDDDLLVIAGRLRQEKIRSTLSGFIIRYTPLANNPPVMTQQPQAPSGLFVGDGFSLTSMAHGTPPLTYQWRRGGTPIPDATGPMYRQARASKADDTDFDVVVSNRFGSVTSSVVRVAVAEQLQPGITKAPTSQTFYVGYPASFKVEAIGGGLSYQWSKAGAPMAGQTNDTLQLPAIGLGDAGMYSVLVSNTVGTASASAALAVNVPAPDTYEERVAALKPLLYFPIRETGTVTKNLATNLGSLGAVGHGVYSGYLTNGVDGALAGSPDKALHLNQGRVLVPYSEAVNPEGSLTVECWAKPTDIAPVEDWDATRRVLVSAMVNGQNPTQFNDRTGWALAQRGADLQFLIGNTNSEPSYTTILAAPGVFKPGAWTHCAAVFHSDTRKLAILVNGIEVTNVTASAPLLRNYAAPLLVGDRSCGCWSFKGSLDEVAVYSKALGNDRLLAHYQAGSNPAASHTYPDLVTSDGPIEYLRLNETGLAPGANAAANLGTLGQGWNGTYVDPGLVGSNPGLIPGVPGIASTTFPGFGSENRSLGTTNSYLTAPTVNLNDRFTLAFWIKREVTPRRSSDPWVYPISIGTGGMILDDAAQGSGGARLQYTTDDVWNRPNSRGMYLHTDQWTFVVWVYEPMQGVLYMSEGAKLLSATTPFDGRLELPIRMAPAFGGDPGRANGGGFAGQIDEIALWDRVLTPAEVSSLLARATGTTPPPVIDVRHLAITTYPGSGTSVEWTAPGVLQSSESLEGPYSDVLGIEPGQQSLQISPDGAGRFFRLRPE